MAGKIFINYRREDSIGMAGRLHDRLAQTFGRDKLFMDVDHIPAGTDFVAHLNSQVAECEVVLVVIGPNWLGAKDESGARRLGNPDDFVAIEIAAALARNSRVIPVLVDGARMPNASQLPDSLKPLARRQAIDVRHSHFGHDAEALVARMREALGGGKAGRRRWPVRAAVGATALVALLLIGWSGYAYIAHMLTAAEQTAQLREQELRKEFANVAAEAEAKRKAEEAERDRLARAEQERRDKAAAEAKATADAEAKRKADEARIAAERAEQERKDKATAEAKAAAEAEAKRKAEEAEQQRVAAAKAEQDRQSKAAAEAETRRLAEEARKRVEAVERSDPALAVRPGTGQSFVDRLADGQSCPACPDMVVLPAGAFMMGSSVAERGRSAEEGPQHQVTIARPFAVGKFPVTHREFAIFVQETGYQLQGGCDVWSGSQWRNQPDRSWRSPGPLGSYDRHPVVCVNWHDAKAFVAWLSNKVGRSYRLLTEAEREYAARGQTATRYSFGDDETRLSDYAWYQANAGGMTHPVGEKRPNTFGLFDIHGNAWAWCEDIWRSSYDYAPSDGSASLIPGSTFRVLRGGSWYRNADGLRSAFRIGLSPDGRYSDVGFRVARGL
jgi:formylglycine-generating enzyme required for sulfatase activity